MSSSLLQTRTGPIIPLYVSATSGLWTTVMNQKDAHPNVPIAVVINISEGPGTAAIAEYQTLINNLKTHNIIVLGYVATDFAQRLYSDVTADVDRWMTFYNAGTNTTNRKVNGIYYAQMSNNTSNQTYYSDLNTYCKVTKGFNTTCGGAGTKVPTAFLNGTCADTVILFEGTPLPPASDYQAYQNIPRNNIGFLAFGMASVNVEAINQLSSIGNWIYCTNDSGVNPWDSLPSYFADLISRLDQIGTGTSTGSQFDTFGIRKIFHTRAGGQEWYLNSDDPTSDERFQNAPALTRNNDGSWSCEGGSGNQVRLEAWSPALSNQTDRQNARWLNGEVTGYLKAEQEFDQGGAYLFQLYIRGGHHSDTRHCEGSTIKSAISRRRRAGGDPGLSAYARKEVCHSAYCDNRAVTNDAVPWTSTDFFNRWIGFKLVVYNYTSGANTFTRQEIYLDRDVQDGNGNLNAQNDWQQVTFYQDTGGWFADQAAFDADCDGCGYPRDRIITGPGGDTRSSAANFNRNLAAWRSDDLRIRFKFLTVREIDPAKPATGTPPPPPSTDPASAFDSFGVRKIYPTKSGGNEWYLAANASNDARFIRSHTMFSNVNTPVFGSSWRVTVASPYTCTFQIGAVTGYNKAETEAAAANHAQCAANGYMYRNGDWRNVEMQAYVNVIQTAPSAIGELIWYARGGEHVDPQPYCPGSSMKGYLATNGESRFAKEQYHVYYNYSLAQNQVGQSIVGKWIGLKYVLYNRKIGTQSAVKQELYLDFNNTNVWTKIDEKIDTNGWGTGGLMCKGNTEDFLISWGGPLATFRLDNISDFDIKFISVREIDGDAIAIEPPQSAPSGSCQTT